MARWILSDQQKRELFIKKGGTVKVLLPQKKVNAPKIAETDLQAQVIEWFAWKYPDIYKTGALIAIPNAGKRGRKAASQMKKEGLWKGASDLVLFWPSNGKHGAVLEMKTDGGKLRPEQMEWLAQRKASGYESGVAWNYAEATSFFENYLK